MGKAGQSDTVANLKVPNEAKSRRGYTGRALITVHVGNIWQVWATYRRMVEIMIWHYGLDGIPDSQTSE